jgi:type IV pilus assembly protein PilW
MRNTNNMRPRGFSLVELMVALIIGSFLIIGAVTVYVQSRNTYAVNETVARLQENARYVISTLEPDLREASFWGLMNDPWLLEGTVGNSPIAPAIGNSCGLDFTIDLRQPIEGINSDFTLPCAAGPAGSAASATADTVIVRRADEESVAADDQRVQIFTTVGGANSRVFNSDTAPGAIVVDPVLGPQAAVHDLIVRAYYISQSSSQPGMPSLRRKNLIAGPAYQDEEILPGVEDLQVQFGIERGTDLDGNGDADAFTGTAMRYVNPDDPALDDTEVQIVAVRLWLLLRADTPEVGFTDTRTYNYADVAAFQPNDSFRRLLVSRTIQIRNTANLKS